MRREAIWRVLWPEVITVLLVLIADQAVKFLCDAYLAPVGTTFDIWPGVFGLKSVHNTGAAFGMFSDGAAVLATVRAVVSAGLVVLLIRARKKMHTFLRFSLALVLAGAVGNIIDQIAFGYVRDMFDFYIINFAVFNVADIAICVGAAFVVLDGLFGKTKKLF